MKRLPQGHRFCPQHPERYLPSIKRAGIRCWLCEDKTPGVFEELDYLIKIGVDCPQVRITPAMLERAEAKGAAVAQYRLKKDTEASVRETQESGGA